MAKNYYITTESREQIRSLLAMKGDDQAVQLDFSPWAEDNSNVSSATWEVEYGDAAVDGESLSSNVASARITTSDSGRSLIKVTATDGTHSKVTYLLVHAKDPSITTYASDYGMVRL